MMMKKWLLHIMPLAIYCMALIACTTEQDIPEVPSAGTEGKVKVSFLLNMPSSRSNAGTGYDDNYYWERYIGTNDVRAFVYKDNKFQEEVKALTMDEVTDEMQNQTRRITGRLTNNYTESDNLRLVVLTNMKSRGVNAPQSVTPGSSPTDLYKQLTFNYTEAWTFSERETNYIPMWGISSPFKLIEPNGWNEIETINMYRAIAKIDIKVNGGEGLGEGKGNFTINRLELCNVPNMGYCASLQAEPSAGMAFENASCPSNMKGNESAFTVYERAESEDGPTKIIENKIYVPEMTMYAPYPNFYIKISATIYEKEKEYTLYMRSNQTDLLTAFEIIRNHKYVININTVSSFDEIVAGYAISPWGEESPIDLPTFN
ncbi:FimB/Mfa2 family fimbrial subunit [Phocaeicola sp.]